MSGIDCLTAEGMVSKYIRHTLSTDELEEFLDHVESCSSCYDELETHFIVYEALQQLDEKEDGTGYPQIQKDHPAEKSNQSCNRNPCDWNACYSCSFFYIGYWELTLFLNCNRRMLS